MEDWRNLSKMKCQEMSTIEKQIVELRKRSDYLVYEIHQLWKINDPKKITRRNEKGEILFG